MSTVFKHAWKRGRITRKWYGEYRDLLGKLRRIALCTDKQASSVALHALKDALRQASAGMMVSIRDVPTLVRAPLLRALRTAGHRSAALENEQKPLKLHIDDWRAFLIAKGDTTGHVDDICGRVGRLLEGCKFVFWSDIVASTVQNYLARRRSGEGAIGIQTSNYYLQGLQQFARWMIRDRRATDNPVSHLHGGNARLDRRHERRALSNDELLVLLEVVHRSAPRRRISGPDRAMLYRMAVETGLRVGELRSLTRSSFDLEAVLPTVTVAAAYSKHRRQDIQPLRREFADQLRPWLDRRPAVGPVFGVPASAAGILRADMAAARDAWVLQAATDEERQRRLTNGNFLMYRDSAGRYADFHALRHTFITNLTRGNVNPRLAQSLARHSTITLTMDRYSHVTADDAAAALGVLPRLPRHTEADRLLPAPLAGPAGFDDFKGGGGPESSPKNWGENWGVPEAFRASPVTFNDIKSEIEVFQGSREGQRNIAIFRLFQAFFQRARRDSNPRPAD